MLGAPLPGICFRGIQLRKVRALSYKALAILNQGLALKEMVRNNSGFVFCSRSGSHHLCHPAIISRAWLRHLPAKVFPSLPRGPHAQHSRPSAGP